MTRSPIFRDLDVLEELIAGTLKNCPLKSYNEEALDACRKGDSKRLSSIIDTYNLIQSCCGNQVHGLLISAAVRNSISCISDLTDRGWDVEDEIITRGHECEYFRLGDTHCLDRPSLHNPIYGHLASRSAIREAARQNSREALSLLLRSGAQPDRDVFADMFSSMDENPTATESIIAECFRALNRRTPNRRELLEQAIVEEAIRRNKVVMVKQMMGSAPNCRAFGLREACRLDCCPDEIFDFLFSIEAKGPRCLDAVHACIKSHAHERACCIIHTNQDLLTSNLHDNGGQSLLSAADAGCTYVLRQLLDLGLDVNHQGSYYTTAIHQACASRNPTTDVLGMLIARGANVNLAIEDRGGRNLAMNDQDYSNQEDMPCVLDAGDTPLYVACLANAPFEETSKRIRMLIAAGADVNVRNEHGYTPLHANAQRVKFWVEDYHKVSVAPLLIGADASIRDNFGHTAQEILEGEDDEDGEESEGYIDSSD